MTPEMATITAALDAARSAIDRRQFGGAIDAIDTAAHAIHAMRRDLSDRMALRELEMIPMRDPEEIIGVVCSEMGVGRDDLYGDGRSEKTVLAREVAALLMRRHTSRSYPEIARALRRPNHSSVITAHARIVKCLDTGGVRAVNKRDVDIRELVASLEARIGPAAAVA